MRCESFLKMTFLVTAALASSGDTSMSVVFAQNAPEHITAEIMKHGFTHSEALILAGALGDTHVGRAINNNIPTFTPDVIVAAATTCPQVNGKYDRKELQDGVIIYQKYANLEKNEPLEKKVIQLKVVHSMDGKNRWTVCEDDKELYVNDQDASATPPAKGWTCVSEETRAVMSRAREADNARQTGNDRLAMLYGLIGVHVAPLVNGRNEPNMVVTTTTACEDDQDVPMPAAVEAPPAPAQQIAAQGDLGGLLGGFLGGFR